jgi:ATP-dependent HslUV protease subunit HslV
MEEAMNSQHEMGSLYGTTVLCLRAKGKTVMGGDGQVSAGNTVLKGKAKKVRRLGEGKVLAGFAGSTADSFTLFERFETKLKDFSGNLTRAAVEMAKDWRTDKILRRLEAMLLVADKEHMYLLTGNGDVVEPDEEVLAIGSGGNYARAAALALLQHSTLEAGAIVEQSLKIASQICIFTNTQFQIEEI